MVDRKQQVLEAAERSFRIFGYKATTMEKVAKDANVGKGTIYTFFADKEELFHAIMEQFVLEMKKAADNAIDHDRPFFENLHRVLLAMLEFRQSHELTIQLHYEVKVLGTPMAMEALDRVEKAICSYAARQLEAALEKGQIRPCDPAAAAFVLLKLYVTIVFDWEQKNGKRLTADQIWDLIQLFVIDGLAADGAKR
ncbi:TetR/AcrR family transcriptional regulator [Gorillibacterium massiliense]|uniref:TetR/AcrR family transcriptional regulator n=1 Tax=Gorillibacterium massiliense TaxID=1280390 RepID=UPI0004B16F81|nr:TetR/AcrR family transcriptional regulator [Gorillibacterium massiliense]